MSTLITDTIDHSSPYISLGTTASSAKKLASKKREIDLPKLAQTGTFAAKTIKLGDKIISELPASTTAELSGVDLLNPIGALSALAVDTMNLAIRSGRVLEFNKELDKLPYDMQLLWQRQVLEARTAHAKGVAKTSLAGVVGHSASVVGAFIPVVGLPATLIGGTVGILKFFAEKNLNSKLRRQLEKITEDYRRSHPSIIEHHAAFKEMHEALKSNYAQAVLERDQAKTETAAILADAAVKDASKHLGEYEISKANFDAYSQALQLIRELAPKETPIDERELQHFTSARLSAFGGSESIEFTSTSSFSSDYVSTAFVGVSKNDRELEKIGLAPVKAKAPAPVKQESQKEKPSSFRLSEFVSSGELTIL